ncbi:THUMP domain-containing class I SAM-dependent RNA methyltransferase [Hutsoniella sourekii]|uniref:THUMP domain-containing class I SAM-dependent RNA methyltransferase n=1 Tax=Hutsoniella sourekii TaxID=87650 RepID=UPI0004807B56|nr:class I SAM-dependent RNA methyltransferase [Hutsoniella sourekii]
MKKYELIATAGAGLEALVARELKDLGYQVATENGRVRFQGSIEDIAKANIYLRTADRIKIIVGQFKATTFEELFDQVYELAWEDIIPLDGEFPVKGRSIKSQLHSVPNVQRITKKAISKKLMDFYHRRQHLPETGHLYPIEVVIRKNQVELHLDTSGESLFKRGYRQFKGEAPLKENMAAALIMLTTWRPDRPLYDPTCGSGTIVIEAAMMGHKIAPGLKRDFAFEKWHLLDPTLSASQAVRQKAEAEIDWEVDLEILGADIDHRMIEMAQENAKAAGVEQSITFKQMQVADYRPSKEYGILIANPPYGDRLLDEDQVHEIYRQMGDIYRPMKTWSKYILTSDENFEEYYGEPATKKRKLYNGPLKVDFYQYWSQA